MAAKKDAKKQTAGKKKDVGTKRKNKKKEEPQEQSFGETDFLRGGDGFERGDQIEAANKSKRERAGRRFFLDTRGVTLPVFRNLLFLDSKPFWLFEHARLAKGEMPRYLTCFKTADQNYQCPTCEYDAGKDWKERTWNHNWMGYLSALDLTPFETVRDGKTVIVKYSKVLYPLLGSGLRANSKMFQEKVLKKHGGKNLDITGKIFKVTRYTDKEAASGTDWELIPKKVKMSMFKEDANPFDYLKVLGFPTAEELLMEGIRPNAAVGSSEDLGSDTDTSGEVDLDSLNLD